MKENDIRWEQRFANYRKALAQLQKFIDKGELSELEKQGLIKAFEYTYELAWKTLKDFLEFLIYQYLIRKPAKEKLKIKSLIDGFKMYMSAAEEKQIAYFNPPELTPEIFEKLLPYAVVLGAEDVWGEKFQNLIDKSRIDQTYQPTWYTGGRIGNFSTFNHTLNSSLSNSLSKSATPPSSSGSGSGGGGFSGGEGGGGGGGGW